MNDLVNLTFACLAGMLLGFIFFGGLCWIVRKCMTHRTLRYGCWEVL